MPLQEEFERSGSWLFKWRSYLPLALVAVLIIAMDEYRYPGNSEILDELWEVVCLLVSFFGLGYTNGVLLTGVIFIIYTYIGGQVSVLKTDLFQAFFILAEAPFLKGVFQSMMRARRT